MRFINANGKIFGCINIIDVCLLLFIIIIARTYIVYTYAPPRINEVENVLLQIYILSSQSTLYFSQPITEDIARTIFVENNTVDTAFSNENAFIIGSPFIEYIPNSREINVLVTFNGTLRKGDEGQYFFNGYQIAPGQMIFIQINNLSFIGSIYRVNYSYYTEKKDISIILPKTYLSLPLQSTLVFDTSGREIGTIIDNQENEEFLVTISVIADIYNEKPYVYEQLLQPLNSFTFLANDKIYEGILVEVS